jgi:bifunctional isochorismate lyase/aryl carrier protein
MVKEAYFKSGTIDGRARELLDSVMSMRDRHQWELVPRAAALLVLDMQRYFLQESSHAFVPSAEAIIPRIRGLQEVFFRHGLPVIQTRHINTENNAGKMKTWWQELLSPDKELACLTDELIDSRAAVVDKSRYDAFFNTGLEGILTAKEAKQVVVTGVMTHLCCDTTARSAFMRGYDVFLAVDATATYNLDFHRAALLCLSHGFAVPVLAQEIMDLIK